MEPLQLEAIYVIVELNRDTVALLPTCGGKTVIYIMVRLLTRKVRS